MLPHCARSERDFNSLRESIDAFENFDQLELALSIEKHVLLEFRRIAAFIYKKNGRYAQSIALSKADKMYKDAIDTAADSGEQELSEDLLSFFVTQQDKECFAATLYTCSHLVRPDVVMEIAWRNRLSKCFFPGGLCLCACIWRAVFMFHILHYHLASH